MEVESFDALRVGLATSDDIRSWSNGEVKKPETINYRTLKPEKDGLFCEKIFGPTKDWECACGKYKRVRYKGIVCERCGVEVTKSSVRRERMGHIELAAPVTHIWYFKGVPSRLGYLLNMAPKDLEKIIYFAAYRIMKVNEADKKADAGLIKEDYLGRVTSLLSQRHEEIVAVAGAEVEALNGHGLTLAPAANIWEAPQWVDYQFAKSIEQIVAAELKNPARAESKAAKASAEEENNDADSAAPVQRDAATEKQIKSLLSEFKKKTDKIVREYARVERPANLQKEQLAWRLFLAAKEGDLIQNDVIFDHFDYMFGDYFETSIGAEAVQTVLSEFDLDACALELRAQISETKGSKQTQAIKRLKVVNSFIQSSTPPTSMVLDVLPVLPPEIRPMVQLDGGRFATSDLNDLYRRVINRNNRLKRFIDLGAVPKTILNNEKRMLQEAVDALFDNGRRGRAVTGTGNRALKSLSDLLKGKQGRFRQNLLGKRVDYSGRSVIVVGPQLKLHQCGLPKLMALELFKPFVMKRLVDQGLAQNIKSAKRMVERSRPQVWGVLEEVIRERPVLLNRAPTLHRLGIQAFEPQLVEGKAIQLHPLVCSAFNADFDGDQMAVHLPLSVEAQAEARILMLASNNILKPSDGRPVAVPTQDMIIGLFFMTGVKEGAIGEGKAFGSISEAQMAFDVKSLDIQAKCRIRIDGELRETTFGRALFNETLPADYGYVEYQVGKKEIGKIVADLVESESRTEVAQSLDRIKDAGFYWATRSGVSMSIADANFDVSGKFDKDRSKLIIEGEKEHTKIQEAFDNGLSSDTERRDALGQLWFNKTNEIQKLLQESIPTDNAINAMVTSGARGNWLQIRSIIGMRGPVATSSGDFAPMPVKGNYLIGLTANEYFINATGARKGNADTAMKTAAAGYLTRRLVDVAQDVIIREADCGTTKGLDKDLMDQDQVELSILARTTAEDIKLGSETIKAGSQINTKLVERLKAAGHETVTVRSVLTCEAETGVCALCYGTSLATNEPVDLGEAIGIIAAQSIGEPGTQLTMRTFHTGGAATSAKKQTILRSIGGKKVREERLISYDITQGLNGVTDLLEARVGWRQQGKVAVMAFWPGKVRIEQRGATKAEAEGILRDAIFYEFAAKTNGSKRQVANFSEFAAKTNGSKSQVANFSEFAAKTNGSKRQVAKLLYAYGRERAKYVPGPEKAGLARFAEKNSYVLSVGEREITLLTRESMIRVLKAKDKEIVQEFAKKLDLASLKVLESAAKKRAKSTDRVESKLVSLFSDILAQANASKPGKGSNDNETDETVSPKSAVKADKVELEILRIPLTKYNLGSKSELEQYVGVEPGQFVQKGTLIAEGLKEKEFDEKNPAFVDEASVDKWKKVGFEIGEQFTTEDIKIFNIYVEPETEEEIENAAELALQYSFSRTTSKTFKKLSPTSPVNDKPLTSLDDIAVTDGMHVAAGDYVVHGTPIPHEVLMVKGSREAAAEIIRGVQAIYGSQGVPLHEKHLEVIVRQMLGKVTVIDSGDTEMLPGEIIDRNRFTKINREAVKNGKKPASARQEVMGMTRASLAAQSWLSAASFQETTRVLTQAALDRKSDKLVGLKENVIIGKLIPAGTGLARYRNFTVDGTEEAKAVAYPNRIWQQQTEAKSEYTGDFDAAGLTFASLDDYSKPATAELE
jgi:DNA-directed RNA polymerase subunit beta'